MSSINPVDLIDEVNLLTAAVVSAEVTAEAMTGFRGMFGTPTGVGTLLVADHVMGIENRDIIVASSLALEPGINRGYAVRVPQGLTTCWRNHQVAQFGRSKLRRRCPQRPSLCPTLMFPATSRGQPMAKQETVTLVSVIATRVTRPLRYRGC